MATIWKTVDIRESRSHDCLIGSHECLLLLNIICEHTYFRFIVSGLCHTGFNNICNVHVYLYTLLSYNYSDLNSVIIIIIYLY